MSTDRHDLEPDALRKRAPEPDEATRQAAANLVWTLTALAFGRPVRSAAGIEAPEHARYGLVLARRIARISAGAVLVLASFGLGAIALRDPGDLAAACVTTWLAGTLTYAVVRAAGAIRGGLARQRGVPLAVFEDASRARAYRLQNASTFVPYVGFIATFALPLGWMVNTLGAGSALSAVAMIAAAVVAYVALRGTLDREVRDLGIDAVGERRLTAR